MYKVENSPSKMILPHCDGDCAKNFISNLKLACLALPYYILQLQVYYYSDICPLYRIYVPSYSGKNYLKYGIFILHGNLIRGFTKQDFFSAFCIFGIITE